jgi:hypothetical protein
MADLTPMADAFVREGQADSSQARSACICLASFANPPRRRRPSFSAVFRVVRAKTPCLFLSPSSPVPANQKTAEDDDDEDEKDWRRR